MTSTPESRREERLARMAARAAMSPADHGQSIVKELTNITGEKWTFGYIGNCSTFTKGELAFDDRLWFAFGPNGAKIGGVRTNDLDTLITMLRGARSFAIQSSANIHRAS